MKHFRLAGAEYRTQIDLTVYRTDIERAVKKTLLHCSILHALRTRILRDVQLLLKLS